MNYELTQECIVVESGTLGKRPELRREDVRENIWKLFLMAKDEKVFFYSS